VANPQKENGFTSLANELLEAMLRSDWSGQDFKVVLLVVRKTYGFHKIEDFISLSQIMELTGMSKIRCSQVVNRLQLMKILTVTENINGIGKKYKLNKDFEKWETVKENINRYKKTIETVKVLRKRGVNENINHKRKNVVTKENTKERLSDVEFIQKLKTLPCYQGIDVDLQLSKMDAYFLTPKGQGKQKTRRFIVGWLNRTDKPLTMETSSDTFICSKCNRKLPIVERWEKVGSNSTCKKCALKI